jgi:hypothetical protein
MAKVQEIYDMAIHLMDEQNEDNGNTETMDTEEYRFRTISILNTAIPALYPYSGTFVNSGIGRPSVQILRANDHAKPDFSQQIPLDDTLCYSVLPYFLAAQLLSGENEDLAAWFLSRYREAFLDLRNKVPGEFEPIRPVYGLF